MSAKIVMSLWIGTRLSTMERLSIQSFLKHGYSVQLFTYGQVEGVPLGVVHQNGSDVLPADKIYTYPAGFGKGSVAAYSNMFRYKALYDSGGWWTDLDVVCLRELPNSEYVFGHEVTSKGTFVAGSALMRMPAGCELAKSCWQHCEAADKTTIRWGATGPKLVHAAVHHFDLEKYVLPPSAFYPVSAFEFDRFIHPNPISIDDSYCVHLWRAKWDAAHIDPDGVFTPSCLYERLKAQYLSI